MSRKLFNYYETKDEKTFIKQSKKEYFHINLGKKEKKLSHHLRDCVGTLKTGCIKIMRDFNEENRLARTGLASIGPSIYYQADFPTRVLPFKTIRDDEDSINGCIGILLVRYCNDRKLHFEFRNGHGTNCVIKDIAIEVLDDNNSVLATGEASMLQNFCDAYFKKSGYQLPEGMSIDDIPDDNIADQIKRAFLKNVTTFPEDNPRYNAFKKSVTNPKFNKEVLPYLEPYPYESIVNLHFESSANPINANTKELRFIIKYTVIEVAIVDLGDVGGFNDFEIEEKIAIDATAMAEAVSALETKGAL